MTKTVAYWIWAEYDTFPALSGVDDEMRTWEYVIFANIEIAWPIRMRCNSERQQQQSTAKNNVPANEYIDRREVERNFQTPNHMLTWSVHICRRRRQWITTVEWKTRIKESNKQWFCVEDWVRCGWDCLAVRCVSAACAHRWLFRSFNSFIYRTWFAFLTKYSWAIFTQNSINFI